MTLDEWLKNKWLKLHTTSSQEVKELLGKVERDLREAEKQVISTDWRFQGILPPIAVSRIQDSQLFVKTACPTNQKDIF